mmetsp:Transcript_20917/g.65960  ORF Transcript_20917/g.65960 Transcript_20917/m.65960 type:complete len:274 (-) Transcript_20917:450-1271(-)
MPNSEFTCCGQAVAVPSASLTCLLWFWNGSRLLLCLVRHQRVEGRGQLCTESVHFPLAVDLADHQPRLFGYDADAIRDLKTSLVGVPHGCPHLPVSVANELGNGSSQAVRGHEGRHERRPALPVALGKGVRCSSHLNRCKMVPQEVGADALVVHAHQLVQQSTDTRNLLLQFLVHHRIDVHQGAQLVLLPDGLRLLYVQLQDHQERQGVVLLLQALPNARVDVATSVADEFLDVCPRGHHALVHGGLNRVGHGTCGRDRVVGATVLGDRHLQI